ncbi:MAG TPA: hypothetical protein VHA75_01635 [Rugosimonospora sp.]|nr:hypothetical protein [Rugosimonospora sp.]
MPVYGGYPGMPVYPGSDTGFTVPGLRDPLVTAPGEGVGGWFNRLFKAFGLHLRAMYLIGLATFGIPSAVFGVLLGVYGPTTTQRLDPATGRNVPEMHFDHAAAFLLLALVFVVVSGFLGALGQGAFVWTLTRRAVDAPAPVGDALRYGLGNAFRLWGWTLLYGLIVGVGVCACVLPGLYLLVAGSLYIPVLLYQRGANPISTSFSMVNKNFGAALGRLVLLFLLVVGAQLILQIPSAIVTATVSTAAGRVVDVVTTLAAIPLTFATVLGAVLLFAELRARQYPLASADLNAAL